MLLLPVPADAPPIPRKLDLKKDSRLRIEWADGSESVYPLGFLRQMCPCAACRTARTGTDPHQLMQPAPQSLTTAHEGGEATATHADGRPGPLSRRERVSRSEPQASEVTGEGGGATRRKALNLPVVPRELTSAADPVHVTDAQLVGNYAIQLTFSDGHASGIYSFVYLREIAS